MSKRKKIFFLVVACVLAAGFNFITRAATNVIKGCDTAIDADCDGLTNEEEILYGTDKNNPDSGNCGYSDGVNVNAGYDPLSCKKIVDKQKNKTLQLQSVSTPSGEFTQDVQKFIETKGSENISTTELSDIINTHVENKLGQPISLDSLPELDRSKIQVQAQPYKDFTDSESKAKLKADAQEYIKQLSILFITNVPDNTDLGKYWQSFQSKADQLSSDNPDYQYFRDIADKLQIFTDQANEMVVPETLMEDHVTLLQILKGFIELKDPDGSDIKDPIVLLETIGKVKGLFALLTDLIQNTTISKQLN